jgi:excinuclease UvrABC nuclease subunit
MEKVYTNTIDWFRREINKSGLPEKYGIYFVYSCTYDSWKNTISLKKLLYIGKAEDQTIKDRVANHEKLNDWKKYLKEWEVLCYACTERNIDISRNEAAYIRYHKPPVNIEYVDAFPFDTTTVKSDWKIWLIFSEFTVYRKD